MRCPRCFNRHAFHQDCRFFDTAGGAVLQPPGAVPGAPDAMEARMTADAARTAASGASVGSLWDRTYRRPLPPAEGAGGS